MTQTPTNTQALLERARKLCDPPTWYRLGKVTDIAHTTISRCMKHNRTLDAKNAFRLAKFLQLEPAVVMGYMEEDRARLTENAGNAEFWSAQLPRLLPSIAIAVAALWLWASPLIGGTHAPTSHAAANIEHKSLTTLYIIRA